MACMHLVKERKSSIKTARDLAIKLSKIEMKDVGIYKDGGVYEIAPVQEIEEKGFTIIERCVYHKG